MSSHMQTLAEVDSLLDDRPWREGRLGMIVIALFFGLFGAWAAFAPLDAGVVATGEVKVAGNRQVVQHRDGGVISRLAVREGDHVVANQILLELATFELAARERTLAGQLIELEASRERLIAEGAHRHVVPRPASWKDLPPEYKSLAEAVLIRQQDELRARGAAMSAQTGVQGLRQSQITARIAGYEKQIIETEEQIVLVDEDLRALKVLEEKGFATPARVRETERKASELVSRRAELLAQIEQSRNGVDEAAMQSVSIREDRAQKIAEELRLVDTQIADVAPSLTAVRSQLERARVRATTSGVVVGLAFFNQGAVVAPGERILELVPDEQDMILQVHVSPMDADNVKVGQRTNVRLSAFEGQQMPYADGVVEQISADRLEDKRNGTYYFTAEIRVPKSEVARVAQTVGKRELVLSPGLPVEVFIPLRQRTALQYLIEPLGQIMWRSFREN
jgi:HlyD family secretion protein